MDKKWNLQDIKPAQPRKRRAPIDQSKLSHEPKTETVDTESDGTVRIGVSNGTAKKRSHLLLTFIVFFVILGVGFLGSMLLKGADITVYPRHREPNVNATFVAYRTPQVGELSYEIMSLEAEGERQVTATGEEEVSTQATGKITIYNTTNSTERLIKNTRFESPTGLIFKITESVVIPAAGKTASGSTIPGEIQADVFADGTGDQYNIQPTRLTVPGFKENNFTELYENIYAENSMQFSGGYEGPKFIIDDQELETEKQRLHTELRDTLLDRIDTEKPAGFTVFKDAVTITYQSLPAVEYGENLVTIKEKALLQIPMFKDEPFANYIAAATVPGYEGKPVRIADTSVFTFSYTQATTSSTDIGNLDQLSFNLSGKPEIIWTYDEGKLKTDIMGKSKTALPTVLGGYPAIERAEAVVRPFWKRSFPNSIEDITVTEALYTE